MSIPNFEKNLVDNRIHAIVSGMCNLWLHKVLNKINNPDDLEDMLVQCNSSATLHNRVIDYLIIREIARSDGSVTKNDLAEYIEIDEESLDIRLKRLVKLSTIVTNGITYATDLSALKGE
jgi:hypothetical protein